jgi:hypothetical protein
MGTRNNPGKFDCYHAAEPDEPMFVLLGRDASAADLVDSWADMRAAEIEAGARPASDLEKVTEARQCAEAMRLYALTPRPGKKAA